MSMHQPPGLYQPGDVYTTIVTATLIDGTTWADYRPVIVWDRRETTTGTQVLVTWGRVEESDGLWMPVGDPSWHELRDDSSWQTPAMRVQVLRRVGRYVARDEAANSVEGMRVMYGERAAYLAGWDAAQQGEGTTPLRVAAAVRQAATRRLAEATAELRRLAVEQVRGGRPKAHVALDAGVARTSLDDWLTDED